MVKPETAGVGAAVGVGASVAVAEGGTTDGIGVSVIGGSDVRVAVGKVGVDVGKTGVDNGINVSVSMANGNKVAVVVATKAPVAVGLAPGAVPVWVGASDASASSVTRGDGAATWADSGAKGDAGAVADVGGGTIVNCAPSETVCDADGEVALDRITKGVSVASIVREGAITDRHISSRINNSRTDAIPTINTCLPVMAGNASCYSVQLQRRQAVRIVMQ